MKIKAPAPVVAAVVIFPDEVQFDCPVCDGTHLLSRTLDYAEERDGTWRTHERPGFECDCGTLIVADFRIEILPPPSLSLKPDRP